MNSAPRDYSQDGLNSVHNHDFMAEPSFMNAYQRGVEAVGEDYQWHWRVHIGLWAAYSASKLNGDFIECGVNKGFMSSAIMQYLNWDTLNKTFYLMDTFNGIDARYLSAEELAQKVLDRNKSGFYTDTPALAKANFAQWKNIRFVVGSIRETLDFVQTRQIAFLHLDMNCALPEAAALHFFWDRLVPGAFVLLDDYAYKGYPLQKKAMDEAAKSKDVRIASLPTGQGLLIKPWRS